MKRVRQIALLGLILVAFAQAVWAACTFDVGYTGTPDT